MKRYKKAVLEMFVAVILVVPVFSFAQSAIPGPFPGWFYKRSITISSPAGTLATYSAKISLTSNNLDWSKIQSDGRDLRFWDVTTATELPYWIDPQNWNYAGQTGDVWVKLASTADSLEMYYGNASTIATSSIRNAFLFGDDWSDYIPGIRIGGKGLVNTDTEVVGSTIYTVTKDWSMPGEIALYRSIDDGTSFSKRITISSNSNMNSPYLDTDGSNTLYIAYTDISNGTYFKRSNDGGMTLGNQVTIAPIGSYDPKILRVSGTGSSATLLAYVREVSGSNYILHIYRSTNGGDTWTSYSTIDTIPTSQAPSNIEDTDAIVTPNGDILFSFEFEYTEAGHSGNYQYRSTNGGLTWGSRTVIYDNGIYGTATGSDNESGHYVIRPDSTTLDYIFVTDEDAGNGSYPRNILKRMTSTDNGVTWTAPVALWEAWGNIEINVVYNSRTQPVTVTTKSYKNGSSVAVSQIYAFAGDFSSAFDYSDNKWVQEEGTAVVVNESGFGPILEVTGYSTGQRAFFRNDTTLPDDVVIEARARGTASAPDFRLAFRYVDLNNHYLAQAGSSMSIFKRVSGTYTALNTSAVPITQNTWYRLKVITVSSTLKEYINDTLRASAIDTTFSGGKIALTATYGAAYQSVQIDDLRVRAYASTEPTLTIGAEQNNDGNPLIITNPLPSGTLPTGTSFTTISVTVNEPAMCRYSTTSNTPYDSMTETFTTGIPTTTRIVLITGLQNGTSYHYYVKCQDNSGNINVNDVNISFSIASPPQIPTNGLIGYWAFNEATSTTAADSSDQNHSGTLVNGPAWTTGKFLGGINFDGTNDYVGISDFSGLYFGPGDFALSVWIKTSNQSASHNVITQDGNGAGNRAFIMAVDRNATGNNVPGAIMLAILSSNSVIHGVSTNAVLTNNVWQHVVGQRKGGILQIYANGVQQPITLTNGTGANNLTIQNSTSDLRIGIRELTGYLQPFIGDIDEVRIYNRGLTAQEVQDIYQATP